MKLVAFASELLSPEKQGLTPVVSFSIRIGFREGGQHQISVTQPPFGLWWEKMN